MTSGGNNFSHFLENQPTTFKLCPPNFLTFVPMSPLRISVTHFALPGVPLEVWTLLTWLGLVPVISLAPCHTATEPQKLKFTVFKCWGVMFWHCWWVKFREGIWIVENLLLYFQEVPGLTVVLKLSWNQQLSLNFIHLVRMSWYEPLLCCRYTFFTSHDSWLRLFVLLTLSVK